jgi:hypothetical protein
MRNTRTTAAYKAFYNNVLSKQHNHPELIGRWGADPGRFETQIMCKKAGSMLDNGKFEQDGEIFGSSRWPYDAKSQPNYSDPPISYIVETRMKCIGTTWWDWQNQKTIGLGYDFDSIIGHAKGVGVSDEELAKLDGIDVPWLEVIRSTRGAGRHIYIWFDENDAPTTVNHTEHAAIARAFIPLIAKHTGLDIEASVDVCGGVMWIHHRNATAKNQGYAQIKPATQILTAAHVPPNWRDNLEVVSGSRARVRVQGWTAEGTPSGDEDVLDEMTQAVAKVPLDEQHLKLLEDLESTGHTSLWVSDHHLWQGHTAGIKTVFDERAEQEKPLKGLFDTNSLDSDPGKPNCLCANTQVITRQGLRPIGDLADKDIDIITSRGEWATAPFKSYGIQNVFAVTLRRGNDTRVIKATKDHRWYVCKHKTTERRKTKVNFGDRKEAITIELEKDQILVQTKPRLVVKPSVIGIQHGLVWGDGTNSGSRKTSTLSLFGEKDAQLLKYFAEHPQRPINRSVGGVEVWNLPYHFKSLVPLNYDRPYLYGWLAGYFAADGCVSNSGACIIRSANEASLKHVRDVCHILGIETSQVTSSVRGENSYKPGAIHYTIILKAGDLAEDFFLIEQHRERWASTTNRQHHYWRVESVVPTGREEVFCCTVPNTHCFCLEDFILIGNCFMRPKPDGAWDVYRFGEGTDECPLWDTQGKWTHTTLHYPATLRQICMACNGYEGSEERQGFLFETVDDLREAMKLLKSDVPIPDKAIDRELSLHVNDQGKVVLVIEKKRSDSKKDFPRYVKTPKGWQRWLDGAIETSDTEVKEQTIWSELDEKIRALTTETNSGAQFDSWVMKGASGTWTNHPPANISSFLAKEGFNKPAPILGGAVYKSWLLTNDPFKPEYPGGRKWNRNAAQLIYAPVELGENEYPVHPTWDRVMNHCGVELNDYIPEMPWREDWGVATGGDYLTAWVACMIQNPFGKLPYLFMYGPQNSGKSSFYEAINLLMTPGSMERADKALTSDQGYNGELEGVVLAVIDEIDISKAGATAYNRIKDWVTGLTFCLHPKYCQPRTVPNTLHFVQLSNTRRAVPVLPGDTRITAMNVPALEEEIPKDQLFDLLRQEAPHFMYTLLNYERPKPINRMMIPVIETQGKHDAAADNVDELEQFIADHCYEIPGAAVRFSDFVKAFQASLEVFQKAEWKERLIRAVVSEKLMYGTSRVHNQAIIGNLSLDPNIQPSAPFVKDGRLLVREDDLT